MARRPTEYDTHANERRNDDPIEGAPRLSEAILPGTANAGRKLRMDRGADEIRTSTE
jgi:hypothetical protein